jgi:hypothetical protein
VERFFTVLTTFDAYLASAAPLSGERNAFATPA